LDEFLEVVEEIARELPPSAARFEAARTFFDERYRG